MARPKVPSAQKRTVKFTLQLTSAEKQQLTELAQHCGKAPATLAREKIFTGRFPQPRAARTDLKMYTELRKIGVNLNQLTWGANAGFKSPWLMPTLQRLEEQQDIIIAALVYDRQPADR
jgi:hypothetical protein